MVIHSTVTETFYLKPQMPAGGAAAKTRGSHISRIHRVDTTNVPKTQGLHPDTEAKHIRLVIYLF